MDRRLWACMALLSTMLVTAGGCHNRSQAPAFDPFINRATIPPPPTGAAAGGTAPAFNAPPAGAVGVVQPGGTPLNPAQPYGPPSAFGSPPTISAPAGQFAPPQMQAPAGTAPYNPPGGYNYQNQYRQGAANDWPETTDPAEAGTARRQIAARGGYEERGSTLAFAGNSVSAVDNSAGVSQVRWAGGIESSNPTSHSSSIRTVSYESAAFGGDQGVSTLRFVETEEAKPRRPAPFATSQSPAIGQSPARNAEPESLPEDDDRRFLSMETSSSANERPATEPRPAAMHSIVSNRTNEAPTASPSNFIPIDTLPVQAATAPVPHSTARFAHDAQYQWLNGRLEYSQLDRRWKLRYIEIDGETDSFGGSVILPEASALQGYQPGEFVTVQGTVDASQTSPGSFAPIYRVQNVQRTGN